MRATRTTLAPRRAGRPSEEREPRHLARRPDLADFILVGTACLVAAAFLAGLVFLWL